MGTLTSHKRRFGHVVFVARTANGKPAANRATTDGPRSKPHSVHDSAASSLPVPHAGISSWLRHSATNAEHEPPEPAAADMRIATRPNGWLRSAPCSCWHFGRSSAWVVHSLVGPACSYDCLLVFALGPHNSREQLVHIVLERAAGFRYQKDARQPKSSKGSPSVSVQDSPGSNLFARGRNGSTPIMFVPSVTAFWGTRFVRHWPERFSRT